MSRRFRLPVAPTLGALLVRALLPAAAVVIVVLAPASSRPAPAK